MEQEQHPSKPSRSVKKTEFAYSILKRFKGEIKETWEMKVREQIPASHGETSLVMLNSLEIFLDELTEVLKQDSRSPAALIEKGMSKIHGQHRATIAGYFLPQLLTEFTILRQVITEKFYEHEVLTYGIMSLIDKAIDTAISLAATEFVSVQQENINAALVKAELSNRDLEQFAEVVAHDLKAPLATISGYLDLLEEKLDKTPEAPEVQYVTFMQKASARMLSLIDRLLDYARLTKTERPFVLVDLNEVLKNTLQNLSATIKETNSKIICENLPTVMGDINLLTQVFQNLFANAIKFHGPEAPVIQMTVDSTKFPGAWLFTITDNGIGFDPQEKENIFILYKSLRLENNHQGAGIGLATCRKVIGLHGGRIWAESDFGKGSRFYFTLPKP